MILVVVAVAEELDVDLPLGYIKAVIGVGKVNAAINTANAILVTKPEKVINFGTAGSLNPEYGKGLYKVGRIVQRDFDARPLAPAMGIVPFDSTPLTLTLQDTGPTLSTGDNFVTSPPEVESDLVDMEGWAIAKVCRNLEVPLEMYKYVTDNADEDAASEWLSQIRMGAREFLNVINTK